MTSRKILAAMLALALVLPLGLPVGLTGCKKKEETAPLRGSRYEGTAYPTPGEAGNVQMHAVPPLWDEAAGALTTYRSEISVTPIPGEERYQTAIISSLVTATEDAVLREEPLPFADNQSVACGWLTEESFTYLFTRIQYETTGQSDGKWYLGRYDRTSGETAESEDIRPFFDPDHGSVEYLVPDQDGDICLGGMNEIVFFSPEFEYRRTIPIPNGSLSALGRTEEGEIRAACFVVEMDKTLLIVSAVDKASGTLTERFRCPMKHIGNPCFGPGAEFYYTADAGIFLLAAHEDGTAEEVPLMDYTLSDVSPQTASFHAVIDRDRLLFTEFTDGADGTGWFSRPVLYARAEETDLPDRVTVTLAVTASEPTLTERIVSFNKSQKEVRIEVTNYGQFATSDDRAAGEARLATDIVTGVFRPDIVIGTPNSAPVRQLFEKDLCSDLTPYLAADDLVNDANLIGAVKNVYGDGHGKLRALSTGVSFLTLAAPDSLLGEYAQRGYWTASEFVDFVSALPDGVAFAQIPCREYLDAILFSSDALAEFIDQEGAVCSFDGPEFRRILSLYADLPALEDALKDPALATLADPDAAIERFYTGRIALRESMIESPAHILGLPALFGTDACTLIGLPTAESRRGAGIRADMRDAIILTSFSEHPDEAWRAIRSLFEGVPQRMLSMNGAIRDPIPTLRTQLDFLLDAYENAEFLFRADGSSEMRRAAPENPTDPASLEQPGIVTRFTDEGRAALYDLLDCAGSPLDASVNEEILAIVTEELSALSAGAASIDSCAGRIQSRVSLWLAEHK